MANISISFVSRASLIAGCVIATLACENRGGSSWRAVKPDSQKTAAVKQVTSSEIAALKGLWLRDSYDYELIKDPQEVFDQMISEGHTAEEASLKAFGKLPETMNQQDEESVKQAEAANDNDASSDESKSEQADQDIVPRIAEPQERQTQMAVYKISDAGDIRSISFGNSFYDQKLGIHELNWGRISHVSEGGQGYDLEMSSEFKNLDSKWQRTTLSSKLEKIDADQMRITRIVDENDPNDLAKNRKYKIVVNLRRISEANFAKLLDSRKAHLKLIEEAAQKLAKSYAGQTYRFKKAIEQEDGGEWKEMSVEESKDQKEMVLFPESQCGQTLHVQTGSPDESKKILGPDESVCKHQTAWLNVRSITFKGSVEGSAVDVVLNGRIPAALYLDIDESSGALLGSLWVNGFDVLSITQITLVPDLPQVFSIKLRPGKIDLRSESALLPYINGKKTREGAKIHRSAFFFELDAEVAPKSKSEDEPK